MCSKNPTKSEMLDKIEGAIDYIHKTTIIYLFILYLLSFIIIIFMQGIYIFIFCGVVFVVFSYFIHKNRVKIKKLNIMFEFVDDTFNDNTSIKIN